MDILLTQLVALAGLITIAILLVVFGYKEYKYRKKVEFLTHLVDKGYESEQIELNNFLK